MICVLIAAVFSLILFELFIAYGIRYTIKSNNVTWSQEYLKTNYKKTYLLIMLLAAFGIVGYVTISLINNIFSLYY